MGGSEGDLCRVCGDGPGEVETYRMAGCNHFFCMDCWQGDWKAKSETLGSEDFFLDTFRCSGCAADDKNAIHDGILVKRYLRAFVDKGIKPEHVKKVIAVTRYVPPIEENVISDEQKAADAELKVAELQREIDIQKQIQKDAEFKALCTKETYLANCRVTRPCPNCSTQATHFAGHHCHHISPYGGCPNPKCGYHYCYVCGKKWRSAKRNAIELSLGLCSCPRGIFCVSLNTYDAKEDCGCEYCFTCFELNGQCKECQGPGKCPVCKGYVKLKDTFVVGDRVKVKYEPDLGVSTELALKRGTILDITEEGYISVQLDGVEGINMFQKQHLADDERQWYYTLAGSRYYWKTDDKFNKKVDHREINGTRHDNIKWYVDTVENGKPGLRVNKHKDKPILKN